MDIAIKIVVKNVGKQPETKIINYNLDEFHKIVGGCFDTVALPEAEGRIYLVCNDIGKLINLPVNYYDGLMRDFIVGNVFFMAVDNEGETISLTEEQIEFVNNYLQKFTLWK